MIRLPLLAVVVVRHHQWLLGCKDPVVANRATGFVQEAAGVGEGHDHDPGAPHIQGRTADRSCS